MTRPLIIQTLSMLTYSIVSTKLVLAVKVKGEGYCPNKHVFFLRFQGNQFAAKGFADQCCTFVGVGLGDEFVVFVLEAIPAIGLFSGYFVRYTWFQNYLH